MKMQANRIALVALGMAVVVGFSACKSSESVYKKAYEKAQASTETTTTEPVTTTTTTTTTTEPPIKVTPVQSATTTTTASNISIREESVTLVSGSGLKKYSVVCGAFSLKANADGLQSTLKQKGYDAQIAINQERQLYRVIATTFDDEAQARTSCEQLRATYPDAWLLYDKK